MPSTTPTTRRELAMLAALAAVVVAVVSLGIGVRSTYGGRAAVDEPEYLLTALSLAEDGDLDISDELAARRWRAFHDTELPVQTAVLADGRQVSPHDPLLPVLLALPMRWGGFVAAKATLAGLAGLLVAVTAWTARHRLGVRLPVAFGVAGLLAVSPPLAVYATQVYPELPAALAVSCAVALITGPLRPRAVIGVGAAVVALPWLSVKYAGVAAVIAVVTLVRLRARPSAACALGVGLAVMAAVYLGAHQLLYGGWTAYATGDHFTDTGELGVVGTSPNLAGRSLRLTGLLVDRDFGLAAWQPAWLLLVPAVVWALRRRAPGDAAMVAVLVVGWLTATYVALTMHGFWWPGRQVVVVLPVAALLLCRWADVGRARLVAFATTGAAGLVTVGWLLVAGRAGDLTWVTGFESVGAPTYTALRPLLPDYRVLDGGDWVRHAMWSALLAGPLLLALPALHRRAVRTADGPHPAPLPINSTPTERLT